eukprot:309657_1
MAYICSQFSTCQCFFLYLFRYFADCFVKMRALAVKRSHGLQCHLVRSFATSSEFYSNFNESQSIQQSREDTNRRLENKSPQAKWVQPPRIREQSSVGNIPGGQYERQRPQYKTSTDRTDPKKPVIRGPINQGFNANSNIKLTSNDSANGGKRDIYFQGISENDNHYQKKYTEFLIEHGFVEEEDINEQYEWLHESYKIQFDPDDHFGLRLPPTHEGRTKDEWTEKELYVGKNFKREKLEFNHFNKSLILDSCPAFPDRQVHHEPTENNESPLYLPHVTQSIPTWSIRKKIAKTYGPSYLSQITLPPMKLPVKDEFQAMMKQYLNEKKYKKHALDTMDEIKNMKKDRDLYKSLNKWKPNEFVDGNKVFGTENKNRKKELGVGTPFMDREEDVIAREYEIWDKDLCYELKHDGDPKIPAQIKDEVFKQFVTSIDRNGSMAPWQKNYAFSLLPKAFGGPQGDYIDTILANMKPKQETVKYELKKYDQDVDDTQYKKKKKTDVVDVTGLGL